jgi:hypothetical protein
LKHRQNKTFIVAAEYGLLLLIAQNKASYTCFPAAKLTHYQRQNAGGPLAASRAGADTPQVALEMFGAEQSREQLQNSRAQNSHSHIQTCHHSNPPTLSRCLLAKLLAVYIW